MEEENKDQNEIPQDQEEQSPFGNTGQVADQAKKIGKKAVGTLRGVGAAGEAAETAATAGAAAGAESGAAAATAGAAAGAEGTTAVGALAGQAGAAAGAASAEAAVGAVAATGGSSLGAWALVAVVAVVFIMTVLIAILGGQQAVTANNYAQNPSATPSGTITPFITPIPNPDCAYIDTILSQQYGATIRNITNCTVKQAIYSSLTKFMSYPGLREKMGTDPLVYNSVGVQNGTCGGAEDRDETLVVNLNDTQDNCSERTWSYIILHEMFHILHNRQSSLLDAFPDSTRPYDNSCYKYTVNQAGAYGWLFKTYIVTPRRFNRENFAESGSLFITNNKGAISDFKNGCPNTWSWWNTRAR